MISRGIKLKKALKQVLSKKTYDDACGTKHIAAIHLNQIPGVLTVGLFAARPADKVLVSNEKDVIELKKK